MVKSAMLAFGMLVYAAQAANAEDRKPDPQHLRFEDDKVEGDIVRPDEGIVGGVVRSRWRSLIVTRANFIPELLRSADAE